MVTKMHLLVCSFCFSPIPHLFLAIKVVLTNLQEHACMRLFQLHLHRVLAHLARVHERIYVEVGSEKAVRLDGLFKSVG